MRCISKIMLSITVLIMIVFGAGGITLEQCHCSGKTTLATLDGGNCCSGEEACMSISQVPLSVAESHPSFLHLPDAVVSNYILYYNNDVLDAVYVASQRQFHRTLVEAPPQALQHQVLRV